MRTARRFIATHPAIDTIPSAVHGQISGNLIPSLDWLHRFALEHDRWVLLGVEEIGTLEVLVALGIVGVDAIDFGGQLESSSVRFLRINAECAREILEAAIGPAQAEVRDAEDGRGVGGVDGVVIRELCRSSQR